MVNLDKLLESQGLYRTAYHTGQSFVWRMLTLKEYRVFKALTNSGAMTITEAYLKVFERCYVGNHLLINENIPVGMLVSIGELIMYISGDCSNETLKNDIATVRNMYPVNNAEEYMKRIIIAGFTVVICSARINPESFPDDYEASTQEMIRWLDAHGFSE